MHQKYLVPLLTCLAGLVLIAIGIYLIPSIRYRINDHLYVWRINLIDAIHPPQEVVFVPTEQGLLGTVTPGPSDTPTPTPLPPDLATSTPTATQLPFSNILTNVPYVDQCNRWNYCGPANLAMALEYWGWKGESGDSNAISDQIALVIKPGEDDPTLPFYERGHSDVNVMPYEMVDYVTDHTPYHAQWRYGGDLTLLKRMIAAGYPVITENGLVTRDSITGQTNWAGHFAFATGYDDSTQTITWQDAYGNLCQGTPDQIYQKGHNVQTKYSDFLGLWRDFDFVFIVVYPADQETQVTAAMGPWAEPQWADQHALDLANQDIQTLSGDDLFFAYFNKGTSQQALYNYGQAAVAYDYAYQTVYPSLPNDSHLPWRIMWYQTGPYFAYYYTSRYQDVIRLATQNLTYRMNPPETLEESLYWRARAEYALQEYGAAVADIQKACYYNKNMLAIQSIMQEWGVSSSNC